MLQKKKEETVSLKHKVILICSLFVILIIYINKIKEFTFYHHTFLILYIISIILLIRIFLKNEFIIKKHKVVKKTDHKQLLGVSITTLLRWEDNYAFHAKSLYVSKNIATLLGYTQDEFKTDDTLFTSHINKNDLEYIRKELQDAINGYYSFFNHSPYRFTKKDGSMEWISHYTLIIRNKDSVVTGYVSNLSKSSSSKLVTI